MRFLFPLLLLTSCAYEVTTFKTMICPKNGVGCVVGDHVFATFEECEQFAKQADAFQTNVRRVCIKSTYGVY